MKAKKMFEKLGYSKTVFPNGTIQYQKTKKDKIARVRFYLDNKVYSAYYVELYDNGVEKKQITRLINAKLHEAITQQMKEMGWIQ